MCKSGNTRASCLDLIKIVSLEELPLKLSVIQYLKKITSSETFWRTPRRSDWSVQLQTPERSTYGFAGLKNLGCICYMNSILQQLYMIPPFRKAMLEVEDRQAEQEKPEDNVLYQIKCIFGGLMEIEK
mmetsp:Transcript_36080/g.55404  ORF Transcript_36080/g.55404 Transcript_36080/m.55404 type:complete len:128 (+) Transcript_36080:4708-5091(+)